MLKFNELEEGKVYVCKTAPKTRIYKRKGKLLLFRYIAKSRSSKMWSISYANKNNNNFIPRPLEKDRGFMGLGGMPV